MKNNLTVGDQKTLTMTVTKEMYAGFDGEVIHETCSTVTLVYYMEWVARLVFIPCLEEGEEGVGASVTVRHMNPAPEGTELRFTATICDISDAKVVCDVDVSQGEQLVGRGQVTQIVVDRKQFHNKIAQLKESG